MDQGTKTALQRNLDFLLTRDGLSARKASIMAGLDPDYAKSLLQGKSKNPTVDRLSKLARVFGCAPTDLIAEKPPFLTRPATPEPPPDPLPASNVDLGREAPPLPGPYEMPRDIRVLGIAVGGEEGDFQMNGEVIDLARRPPALRGTKTVFAVYMVGESMQPWRKPGELVYVNTQRPANINDHVLIEMHGKAGEPGKAMVKLLLRRTATELVLRQYNPAKDYRVPRDKVKHLYRVIEWSELHGV